MEKTKNLISPGDSGQPEGWNADQTELDVLAQIESAEAVGINCSALRRRLSNPMPEWERDLIETEQIVFDRSELR